MLKKWTGLFLAMVLVMALCPTVAMAENTNNWDMEVWSEPNQPDGFTITPGEGATVTCDKTDILGNTSNKIKISHPEETATAETVTTVTFKVSHENDTTMSAGYYMSFWLESLKKDEEGNALADTGLKFSLVKQPRWAPSETEFFKDTNYQKWRKMMTYTANNVYGGEGLEPAFTVTFKGVGVVYLDDFEVEISKLVINGELEGLIGDGKLAGGTYADTTATNQSKFWTTSFTSVKPWEQVSEITKNGLYFVETNDNNYLLAINWTGYCEYQSTLNSTDLVDGVNYRVSVSNKSNTLKNGCRFYAWAGYALPNIAGGGNGVWSSPTLDWEDKSIVFLYHYGSARNQINISFSGYNKTTEEQPVALCYFDNIRLEEVTEKVVLKNADDKDINALTPGTVTLSYEAPLFNAANDVLSDAKTDGYMTQAKITAVAVLYKQDGDVKTIVNHEMIPNLTGKTDSGAAWPDSAPETTEVGFRPAQHDFSFEIPETGDYVVKVFAWNTPGSLTPFSGKSYSFSTASK